MQKKNPAVLHLISSNYIIQKGIILYVVIILLLSILHKYKQKIFLYKEHQVMAIFMNRKKHHHILKRKAGNIITGTNCLKVSHQVMETANIVPELYLWLW